MEVQEEEMQRRKGEGGEEYHGGREASEKLTASRFLLRLETGSGDPEGREGGGGGGGGGAELVVSLLLMLLHSTTSKPDRLQQQIQTSDYQKETFFGVIIILRYPISLFF